jgi:hypothetical protein
MYGKGLTDYLISEGVANARQEQLGEVYRKKNSTVLYYPGVNSKYAKIEAGAYLNDFGLELGLTQADLDAVAAEYTGSFQIYEATELDDPNVSRSLRTAAVRAKEALYSTEKTRNPAGFKKNIAFRFLSVLIYWEKESERVRRAEAKYFQIEPPRPDRSLDNPRPFSWRPGAEGGQNGQVYWHPEGITGEPATAPAPQPGPAPKAQRK